MYDNKSARSSNLYCHFELMRVNNNFFPFEICPNIVFIFHFTLTNATAKLFQTILYLCRLLNANLKLPFYSRQLSFTQFLSFLPSLCLYLPLFLSLSSFATAFLCRSKIMNEFIGGTCWPEFVCLFIF